MFSNRQICILICVNGELHKLGEDSMMTNNIKSFFRHHLYSVCSQIQPRVHARKNTPSAYPSPAMYAFPQPSKKTDFNGFDMSKLFLRTPNSGPSAVAAAAVAGAAGAAWPPQRRPAAPAVRRRARFRRRRLPLLQRGLKAAKSRHKIRTSE
jgi:hypothetical protein